MSSASFNELDTLLDSIHAIRMTDFVQTVDLASLALAQAEQLEDPERIVRSLNYLAWGYNRQSLFTKAIKPAQEALVIAQENGLLEAEGYALCNLSLCYDFVRQREESFRALYRQLEIGEQLNHAELIQAAHNDLGALYYERREYDRAVRHYERAIAANVSEKSSFLSFPLINLARLVYEQGNVARALELAEACLKNAYSIGFSTGIAAALRFIANTQIETGDLDAAAVTLERCEESQPALRTVRAELAHARGDIEEAVRLLRECLGETQCFDSEAMEVHRKLAQLYAEQGNYADAYRHSQASIDRQTRWLDQEMASRVEVANAIYELEALRRELDERKRTEAERLERERAEIALEQQQEFDAIKQELIARLSHEFRTPLTIMRTSFDLLTRYADRLTAEKRVRQIEKIDEQFLQIERLLDNILDVLRAEGLSRPLGVE